MSVPMVEEDEEDDLLNRLDGYVELQEEYVEKCMNMTNEEFRQECNTQSQRVVQSNIDLCALEYKDWPFHILWLDIAREKRDERERLNTEAVRAQISYPPIQLESEGTIRILRFTTGNEYGHYTDLFSESHGGGVTEYKKLYDDLGEPLFMVHLFHAWCKLDGRINYAKLCETCGYPELNRMRRILKNGCLVLFDQQFHEEDMPYGPRGWNGNLHLWMLDNNMITTNGQVSRYDNWQRIANDVLDSSQPIVPAEIILKAKSATPFVNYRDMLGKGEATFNRFCRDYTLSSMVGLVSMKNELMGITVKYHETASDSLVITKDRNRYLVEGTEEDPYMQMYWYFVNLGEAYKTSNLKDISRFTGDEYDYIQCYVVKESPDPQYKWCATCKICKHKLWSNAVKSTKWNPGPHLLLDHPLVHGVVIVNKGDANQVAEECYYPKRPSKAVLATYRHMLF
jgi:hypothetical protein